MFFLIEREEVLALHPKHFGKNLHSHILTQLRLKVEGKCTGRFGYTICVTSLEEVCPGKLHEDSGYAHFPVRYYSLVFRPFKNEILPCRVSSINASGFFASAGPFDIFISEKLMPSDLKYDPGKDGLPLFYSETDNVRIEIGSDVKVKVVGVRISSEQIVLVGTIKEDYLG
jgi:DNA-directed RNA polymerase II subunit RPB7